MQAKFWKKHDGPKMELKVIQTNFGCINNRIIWDNSVSLFQYESFKRKRRKKLTYDIDSSNFAP